MNDLVVAEDASARSSAIHGGSERSIEATTVVRNERLDDRWLSPRERDPVTTLTVDR
jgi:LEA14-like dessication related protein